jgi:hypothetical protein
MSINGRLTRLEDADNVGRVDSCCYHQLLDLSRNLNRHLNPWDLVVGRGEDAEWWWLCGAAKEDARLPVGDEPFHASMNNLYRTWGRKMVEEAWRQICREYDL